MNISLQISNNHPKPKAQTPKLINKEVENARARGSCIISSISVKHKIIHQHTWAWPMWHKKKNQMLVDSTDWIHGIVLALKEKGLKM
jgi:hypothetical protein